MGYLNTCTFTFNHKNSDLYNLAMCWTSKSDECDTGLDRSLVKGDVNMLRHKANVYGSKYSSVIQMDFNIMRLDGEDLSQEESRILNRWLLTDTFAPFHFNDNETENVIFNVMCTSIKDIVINGLNGKHLTFEADAPFGYTPEKKMILSSGNTKKIMNSSDDGDYFPVLEISCDPTFSGNIILTNITDNNNQMIFNMENYPITNNQKIINIDTEKQCILDGAEHIVPLYKIGWSIIPDQLSALQTMEHYWFKLVSGENIVKVQNANLVMKCKFPRKVGVLK